MSKCEQCIVRQLNTLKSLSREELIRVSACKTTQTIKRGEVIFREGEAVNGVYCIKDGVCKVSKLSENGRDQILKLIKKGDLLGQRSLINGESTNLTATALHDMEVCFIPKEEIMKDLQSNSNFSMAVLHDMATHLKEADNFIVDMAQKPVKARIAETLVYINDTFGEDEEGFLSVILSRDDYASIVGTATESAIRILSQFKKDGFITTSGKRIKILDLNSLKNYR